MTNDAKKRILIVDDDLDFLMQMEVQLRTGGYEVRTANGKDQALAMLVEAPADLMVVDLMMDHVDDGFVLCHRVKKDWPQLPVVMVSAVAGETGIQFDATTDEERSWIKADAMLSKPIRFEQLTQTIERLLKE